MIGAVAARINHSSLDCLLLTWRLNYHHIRGCRLIIILVTDTYARVTGDSTYLTVAALELISDRRDMMVHEGVVRVHSVYAMEEVLC